MITVSGQLTDQLRDMKDFISFLLTNAESLITSYPKDLLFSPHPYLPAPVPTEGGALRLSLSPPEILS